MEVRPGYKRTEVGVIPEEWEVKPLAPLCAFITKGATPTTYGFRWEQTGMAFLRSECVSERGLDLAQAMHISEAAHALIKRSEVADGDILMTITGYVGRVIMLSGVGRANISQHIARIRVTSPSAELGYVFQILSRPSARRYFNSIATGQAYPQISLTQVRETVIPLPPSAREQREIAAVLTDANALIQSLEQLLEKKRQLKRGAMQELLTGKRRLPGFVAPWRSVKAGDIGRFQGGSGFPTSMQGAASGEYPFFKVSDMNADANQTFMTTAANYVSEAVRRAIGATALPTGALVFAKVGAAVFLERKKILAQPSCLDNNMAAFAGFEAQADSRFLHYVFLNTRLSALVATTALPALSASALRSLEVGLPPLPEQHAIAAVLSDMDAEIEALKAKLAKARLIKQGMMQELLTGRIRLV